MNSSTKHGMTYLYLAFKAREHNTICYHPKTYLVNRPPEKWDHLSNTWKYCYTNVKSLDRWW